MYGRRIAMHQASLQAYDHWRGRRDLATLLIHLYGEDAFNDARGLVRDNLPAQRLFEDSVDPTTLQWLVESEIELKAAAIKRRKDKDALDQKSPALKAIVGESQNVLHVCQKVIDYARISDPVLITGASGTGKEVVARALAEVSGRKFSPFNCGAVAEGVLESELFGHVKGAFTGATADKPGLFEILGDLVIFLDEIGDTSPKFQVDLLRVVENREFYRVGDTRTLRKLAGSTKIVCATAKDLTEEMKARRFREDLFHRMNGLTIHCTPLEKRPEDVQLLVRHFLDTAPELQEYGPFSAHAIDYWIERILKVNIIAEKGLRESEETLSLEGNIRELRARVRKAVLDCELTRRADLPIEDRSGSLTYTKKEIELYDWTIALAWCRLQKDAGRLMGIDDERKVGKILKNLELSKKQRKKQAPQA